MGVTAADVAKAAKVSDTTVALCFQEESRISAKTRQRVLETAKKLGYVPNQFARRLRAGKSRLIALLVAETHSASIAEIIADVERACIGKGYNVLVFNTFRDIEIEKHVVQSACELMVEGIIVMASEETNEQLLQLCREHFPVVYLNSLPPVASCNHIIYDMEAVGSMGTEYLLGLGHKRILLINSEERSKKFSSFARLENNYRRTLQKHGIKLNPRLTRYAGTTMEDGYNAIKRALDEGIEFSAVLAICDEAAFGAIECLEEHGRKVPDEVSVLGIDNVNVSALSRISLTTIEIYNNTQKKLGNLATDLLFDAIENGKNAMGKSVVLTPRLIKRNSCMEYRQAR